MPLPRIPSAAPIEVPAADAKSYPDLFITFLRMIHSGGKSTVDVTLSPYNYDTSELGDGAKTNFKIADAFAEAGRVPLLATVMGGLVTVTGLLIQEKDLVGKIATAADEDKAALESSLAEVRTALGIS